MVASATQAVAQTPDVAEPVHGMPDVWELGAVAAGDRLPKAAVLLTERPQLVITIGFVAFLTGA